MPDFNVRSDAVNVEQIMEQIRSRIREKRGADYTEAQIQELASVKLEKFLDPRGVRSDLLEQFRRAQPPYGPPELPNFAFEDQTLFESTRGPLRFMRKLLRPILKLFFNPNPLIQALNIQSKLNAGAAEREAKRDAARYAFDQLHYEVMHNLVLETTRLGIEVKNLKMRLESLASRLEFNERRARALESVVAYKPGDDGKPEGRRDEARREDARRDDTRREEGRRDDGRRQERQERQDRRHAEQARPTPATPAPPAPPAVPVPAIAATPDEPQPPAADTPDAAAQAGSPAEGPGQRSRRRRRRRGRRGSGSAATLMAGGQSDPTADGEGGSEDEGGPDGEMEESTPETVADSGSDGRAAQPESFEPTSSAQAQPAAAAASDPLIPRAAPPAPIDAPSQSSEPEQPQADPAATPEQ